MSNRVRLRAVLAGLLLGVAICALAPFNDLYMRNTPLAGSHFPMAPFFIILWMFVLSDLFRRATKLPPFFNGLELLVIWVMMVIVSGIGASGLAQTFFINVTAPEYFAKDGYRWAEVVTPLAPAGWHVSDPEAVHSLYNGLESGRDMGWWEVFSHIHWQAWGPTLLIWGGFVLLSYFVMLCLVNLFSRQWLVNERVNFPLLRVPQLMAESYDKGELGSFLTNRFLLFGLLVPVLLHTLNGLNNYYPQMPLLPTMIDCEPYFPKYGLFSGFHKLKIYLYPAFIGFAFLTSRQISFSFWFWYVMGAFVFGILYVSGMQVPEGALGVTFSADFSRPEQAQTIGAYFVFFLFLVWLARFHLGDGIKRAFGFKGQQHGSGEWAPTPWSFWGLIIGMGLLVWWCLAYGLSLLAAIMLPLACFMVLLVASRIICQGGLGYFTLPAAPSDGLFGLFGSRFFSQAGVVAAVIMQKVLFVDMRESIMPSLFHGAKVEENANKRGRLLLAIGVLLLLAVAVSFVSVLVLGYKYGLRDLDMDWASRTTLAVYENAQRLLDEPASSNSWVIAFAAVGAGVMFVLVFLYYRFPWWPLHPLGYLAAYSTSMKVLWFSFLAGWLCNHLTLHYGGTDLFKRVRLFFIGLIIGDFLMGGIYGLVGLYADPAYRVLPL